MSAARGLSLALLALLLGCSEEGPQKPVNILLAWDRAGVEIADGEATITTNTGYIVVIDRLEITTYSFELVPCDDELFRQLQTPARKQARLSFIGTAWAGHAQAARPTRTFEARVESPLRDTKPVLLDHLLPPDYAYCRGHYLVARAPETADAAANAGASVRLHGRYRHDATSPWAPLEISTGMAHGTLIDIADAQTPKGISVADGPAIIVTRRLATMFDDIDLASAPEREISRQMLRQLMAGASVVRSDPP